MKKLVALAALILLSPNVAVADYFQIFEAEDGRSYVAYGSLSVDGKRVGSTDMYGRLKIDRLPVGNYTGEIQYRGQLRRVRFTIDGSRELKLLGAILVSATSNTVQCDKQDNLQILD